MNDLFDIKDKAAVITGGGGVLCGTMAMALAEAGAKVAVLDLVEAAAAKVVDKIKAGKGKAIAVKCDVLDKKSIEAAKEKIIAKFSRIDVLINGAGGNKKDATTSPDLSFFDLPSEAIPPLPAKPSNCIARSCSLSRLARLPRPLGRAETNDK